ncbi:MAG: SLC13 family permease [Candidatus Thorarchaeota archaeon]
MIFLLTLLLIVTRMVHHTTAALIGAVLSSIALIMQGVPGQEILSMVRLEPILIITSMTIVAEVIRGAGVFQFLAVRFIRLTRGDPKRLFIIFCILTTGLSMVLMNTVVFLIMGYLAILTCMALKIKPHAFLLGEMLAIGVGGAFTLIGTSSNIIVANYAGFDFIYYILQFGGLALIVLIATLIAVFLVVRSYLVTVDKEALEQVMSFDPWMMVPNRRLFWVYASLFGVLIVAFALFPQAYVVALAGMMVFMIVGQADPRTSLRDVEWDIIFFIGALFILSGALEYVGILRTASEMILQASGGNLIPASLMVLWGTWFSALIIGGSPTATTFAPLGLEMATTMGWAIGVRDPLFWGIGFGASLGGVASPFGTVPMLIFSMTTFKDSKMSPRTLLIIGILVNLIQIGLCSLYILLLAAPV